MSVQHVDRYQTQLDLCERHLYSWIEYADTERAKQLKGIDDSHAMSRSLMDCLVIQHSRVGVEENGIIVPRVNPVRGIQALQQIAIAFVASQKDKP